MHELSPEEEKMIEDSENTKIDKVGVYSLEGIHGGPRFVEGKDYVLVSSSGHVVEFEVEKVRGRQLVLRAQKMYLGDLAKSYLPESECSEEHACACGHDHDHHHHHEESLVQ